MDHVRWHTGPQNAALKIFILWALEIADLMDPNFTRIKKLPENTETQSNQRFVSWGGGVFWVKIRLATFR